MNRYRLVTRTTTASGTEEHVSSVVQTRDEILEGMEVERQLARATGWRTASLVNVAGTFNQLVCTRGETVRTLTIRETDPFDDTIPH